MTAKAQAGEDKPTPLRVTELRPVRGFRFANRQASVAATLSVTPNCSRNFEEFFELSAISEVLARVPDDRLRVKWTQAASASFQATDAGRMVASLARLVTAVQASAGMPVSAPPLAHPVTRPGVGDAVVHVELDCPTLQPMALAQQLPALVQIFNEWLQGEDAEGCATSLAAVIDQLERVAPSGTNSRLLLDAAYRLGLPLLPLVGQAYQLGWGARSRWIESSFTDQTSGTSARLARDKRAANLLLRQNGLPVAHQVAVASVDDALKAASGMGFPIVLKPSDLDGGAGVYAGLRNEDELRTAFSRAREKSKNLIVESQLPGYDYRLGIAHGRLAWATYREPAGVHGDGAATVAELIAERNRDVRRGKRRWSMMSPITVDAEAQLLLHHQRLTLESIPEKGRFVRLRQAANISGGGYPTDIVEKVHPDNAALAIRAARVFRLDIAGIDFITPDITRSWREVGGAICEVNGQPQFSVSRLEAPFQTVAGMFSGDGRIPVITVLGSVDHDWLERLALKLQERGLCTGLQSPASLSVGGVPAVRTRLSAFEETQILLRDPSLDVALIAPGEVDWLATGLPFDRLDLLLTGPDAETRLTQALRAVAMIGARPVNDIIAADEHGLTRLADEIVSLARWHDANELPLARITSAAMASSPYCRTAPPIPGSIGLCMIAKNEAHVIRRSLDSVRGLVDYVLVEDTGSTDGTQQVVRDWLAENGIDGAVVETPWRDFAWNRTQALAHLRAIQHIDYAFILDADDVVQLPQDFDAQAFKTGLTADVYDVSIRQGQYRFPRPHLCRNAKAFGYRAVLHEYLDIPEESVGREQAPGIVIDVLNQGARSQNPRKYLDDAAVLESALEAEQDPHLRMRYTFYLAQSYRDAGEPQKALTHYLARASIGGWPEEAYVAWYCAAKLREQLNQTFEVVERAYLDAISACPTRAEAYHGLSRHYRLHKRFADGLAIAQAGLAKAKQGRLFVEQWIGDYGLLDEGAVNAFWCEDYSECAALCARILEQPNLPERLAARVRRNLELSNEKLALRSQ